MARLLTLALLIFVFANLNAQQKFVIDKNNFKIVARTDTFAILSASALQSVAKPTYGEEQKWDYSKLNIIGLNFNVSNSQISSNPNMKGAFLYKDYFEVIAANRGYYYDEYYILDESGYKGVMWGFDDNQNYFIGDLTGNPADSIFFPSQYQIFDSPRYVLKFPSNYATSTTSKVVKNMDFNLTLTAFGLNNAPCEKVSYITQVDSVVGWGTLKVPNIKNLNGESKANDVVLVQRITTRIDSLFLNGNPAPAALLMAFGVEQGAKTTSNRLIFWRENRQSPLLSIYYDPSFANPTNVLFDIDTDIESSVENSNIEINNLSISPNPVQTSFKINLDDNSEIVSEIIISDIFGNIVDNIEGSEINNLISLNSNYSNGIYFVRIYDNNGKVISKSKFIVKR